jgi:hypothetical protein
MSSIPANSLFYRSDVEKLVATETQRLREAMKAARDILFTSPGLDACDAHGILNAALEDK